MNLLQIKKCLIIIYMLDRESNAVYNPSYFHSISGGKNSDSEY